MPQVGLIRCDSQSELDFKGGSKDQDRGIETGRKDEARGCREGKGLGTNSPQQGMNDSLWAGAEDGHGNPR